MILLFPNHFVGCLIYQLPDGIHPFQVFGFIQTGAQTGDIFSIQVDLFPGLF